jgi:hypothetical protein
LLVQFAGIRTWPPFVHIPRGNGFRDLGILCTVFDDLHKWTGRGSGWVAPTGWTFLDMFSMFGPMRVVARGMDFPRRQQNTRPFDSDTAKALNDGMERSRP